jgi:hypothetical protein
MSAAIGGNSPSSTVFFSKEGLRDLLEKLKDAACTKAVRSQDLEIFRFFSCGLFDESSSFLSGIAEESA